MFVLTILIISISLGSVILDSNLEELCSKEYFDTISVKKSSDGNTTLLLERMKVSDSKSSPKAVHSWSVLIEEQNGNFKPLDISYTPNGVKSYSTTNFSQPKECPIDVTTVWTDNRRSYSHTLEWKLQDFFITNIKSEKNGKLRVEYVGKQLEVVYQNSRGKGSPPKETDDPKVTYIESSQLFSISMIAILCKASDKSLYAIVEEEPPNHLNRKQFVARLMVENYNVSHFVIKDSKNLIQKFRSEQRFWLELMNQTIADFLGIDCKVDSEEDSEFLSDDILFVMFWVLLGIGIILFIADTGLVIKINAPKLRNTSTSSTASSSSDQKESLRDSEITMDSLTLKSDTK